VSLLVGRREMRRKARPAEIVLEPNLSRCIETTAREEFRRSTRLLLEGESQPGLAERTELLRSFLETADFSELRRLSEPFLAEGRKVTFAAYPWEISASEVRRTLLLVEGMGDR
jgi:hypothetical protein